MTDYDPISLRRPIAELERWAVIMLLWFKPQILPLPVITIQGGFREAYGWFAWSRWEFRDSGIFDEINFVPEHLGRDPVDTAQTLLHELVHLANYTAGIRDSSSNNYHNANFRDRALSVGLTCERFNPYGWAKTGLTPALLNRIELLQPDPRAFDLFRLPPAPSKESVIDVIDIESGCRPVTAVTCRKQKKKKLSKWTCAGSAPPPG